MTNNIIRKCPVCGNALERVGITHLLDPPHTHKFLGCRKCYWKAEIIQKATVKKVMLIRETWKDGKLISQESQEKTVYTCEDINEAALWVDKHRSQLASGDRFDIYYRYEES